VGETKTEMKSVKAQGCRLSNRVFLIDTQASWALPQHAFQWTTEISFLISATFTENPKLKVMQSRLSNRHPRHRWRFHNTHRLGKQTQVPSCLQFSTHFSKLHCFTHPNKQRFKLEMMIEFFINLRILS
jgi:hypothetical protein